MSTVPKLWRWPVRTGVLGQALYLGVLVASVAASLKVHALADLRLPPPWYDESGYLWQAINITDHASLFAPQLNPDRVVMWTMPGYQVFMGLLFKTIPSPLTLEAARAVSWLLVLVAYLELLWLFRGRTPGLLPVVAAASWYLGAHFVVLGNTARMEALEILLVLTAFISLDANHPYKALALLLVCPLVHPNGAIFLSSGLLYVLWQGRQRPSPTLLDRLLVGLSLLCVAAYGVFAMMNWQALAHDWGWQFAHKAEQYAVTTTLRKSSVFLPVVIVVVLSVMHALLFKKVKPLVLLAVSFLVPQVLADELFYAVYTSLAFLIAIPLGIDVISEILRWRDLARPNIYATVLSTLLVAGLLVLAYGIGFVESPIGYPNKMRFGGMRLSVRQPYLTAEDKAEVMQVVAAQLADSSSRRVSFWPAADGLLYWPEPGLNFLPYQPVFTEVTPDVVVFHASTYIPDWWQPWTDEFWTLYGFQESDLVRRRDGSEAWYVKKVAGSLRHEYWGYNGRDSSEAWYMQTIDD